ncbi:MAG: MmcQ/YjbR family DNA-binding protein [Bacteroidia bacterium]|nr:MmcQ/YjbR family DNA-binding protein [Bacteroidia bacterium]
MVTIEFAEQFGLKFPETDLHPHFDKVAVRVKKKIFMTINKSENRVCVRLNAIDQDVFCRFNAEIIHPVPNAWGKYGWTLVYLKKVRKSMFQDIVTCAYCNVAPPKLAATIKLGG